MTQEEKARAYDEALKRAKEIVNDQNASSVWKGWLCNCFPKLKESEDERIRKELLRFVECSIHDEQSEQRKAYISWLEKQGRKTHQTPQWMIDFLDENRGKFASLMEDYDEQREAEGKLLAIIDWLEKQGEQKPYGQREECLDCQVNYVGECKGSCELKRNEQNPAWSEEDKDFMYDTLSNLTELKDSYGEGYGNVGKCITWLKSLRERLNN